MRFSEGDIQVGFFSHEDNGKSQGYDEAGIYFDRGTSRYKVGNFQGALDDMNSAISRDSSQAIFWLARAYIRKQLANKPQAVKDFEKAAQLYSQNGNQEDYEKAVQQIRELEK